MEQSRRDILRASAGLMSVGALSSIAGCGALPGGGGGGGILGGGAAYRDWLVAPDEVSLGDDYSFTSLAPSSLADSEEFSDEDIYDTIEEGIESTFDAVDLDFEDIETTVSLDNEISVALGSFDVETLSDELDDNDYDEEAELDSGELVFVSDTGNLAVLLSSDYVAVVPRPELEAPPQDAEPTNPDVRSISYGQTITSRIESDDPNSYSHRGYHEPITFQGTEGDVITIQMVSEDDTYLQLEGPSGSTVTSDDDGGTGLNSEISDYTLQESGEYTIIATSFSDYDTFTYSLRLTAGSGASDLVDEAETFAGVQSGDTPTYTDESDDAADLVDALGGGDIVTGSVYEEEDTDDPENGFLDESVANGLSFSLDGDVFNVTGVVVFDSESDLDTGDVEDWAEDGTSIASGNLDDIEVSENGRVATVSATVDIDDLV